jgi:hypothetical protein
MVDWPQYGETSHRRYRVTYLHLHHCNWWLLKSGKVIARTTVQHVVCNDYLSKDIKWEIERFDQAVLERLSDRNFVSRDADGFYIQDALVDVQSNIARAEEDYGDMATPEVLDADDNDNAIREKYLNAELMIFNVGTPGNERKDRMVKHANGVFGESIGRAHPNPLFDIREYVVEFTDGSTDDYFANVIAKCV